MAQRRAQRNNGSSTYAILGMAAGAAIGAGVALVYSPATGEENRRRLLEWAQARLSDAQDQIQSRINGVQNQVQSRAGDLQDKAQQVATQSADWATNRATEVRGKAEELTKSATEMAQSVVRQEASSEASEGVTAETSTGDIR